MNIPLLKEIEKYTFSKVLSYYSEAIKIKASSKKKKEDQNMLIKLDKFIQDELHLTVSDRKESHLVKDELVKLMKWKLLRGKWRPRLLQLIESNSDTSIEEASCKAIQMARNGDIETAVQKLCELKGVGPATASAILSVGVPTKCAFFADEVAQIFIGGKLSYSLKEYLTLNKELGRVAKSIKEVQDGGKKQWTPHSVELVLWTYSIIKDSPTLMEELEDHENIRLPKRRKT